MAFGVTCGVAWVLRRRSPRPGESGSPSSGARAAGRCPEERISAIAPETRALSRETVRPPRLFPLTVRRGQALTLSAVRVSSSNEDRDEAHSASGRVVLS